MKFLLVDGFVQDAREDLEEVNKLIEATTTNIIQLSSWINIDWLSPSLEGLH